MELSPTYRSKTSQGTVELDLFGSDKRIALVGLKETFEELLHLGWMPNTACEFELLRRVRARNPIPSGFDSAYAAALGREYRRYYDQKKPRASG